MASPLTFKIIEFWYPCNQKLIVLVTVVNDVYLWIVEILGRENHVYNDCVNKWQTRKVHFHVHLAVCRRHVTKMFCTSQPTTPYMSFAYCYLTVWFRSPNQFRFLFVCSSTTRADMPDFKLSHFCRRKTIPYVFGYRDGTTDPANRPWWRVDWFPDLMVAVTQFVHRHS